MTDGTTGAHIEPDGRYDSATSAQCVACHGETDLHVIGGCGRSLCENCLKRYLEQVMADQTNYPRNVATKRCSSMDKNSNAVWERSSTKSLVNNTWKKLEITRRSTTPIVRVVDCGSTQIVVIWLIVVGCHISTFAWCKEAAEEGHECTSKRSGQKFSQYATQRGMRRCYQSGVWVERVDGCRQVMWLLSWSLSGKSSNMLQMHVWSRTLYSVW